MVAAYTHVFSPNVVNQVRAGFAHLHTTRYGPVGSQMGVPAQYGIQDIPQVAENGGLPDFYIGNLTNLGSNNYLPSDEATATLQVTDDFTRIYGKHSFKMGVEYQHVKFSTLQPAWSRGAWDYSSNFTDIPNQGSTNGGMAQMLLPPVAAPTTIGGNPNPNGFSYSGGADSVYASNIGKTYDEKMYFASYFEDDWKMTPKLTLNLGVRWDFFGPINEQNGGQANFVPIPLPAQGLGNPTFILPASGKDNRTLSTGAGTSSPGTCQGVGCWGLVNLLAADGITLDETNRYGQGLLQTQKENFAPRLGLDYQITRKLVGRGGFGLFYNSFENQGYGPNIGENYPFQFNFNPSVHGNPSDPHASIVSQVAPVSYNTPFAGCSTAGPGGTASLESGFSCIPLTPTCGQCSGSRAARSAVRLPDTAHIQRKRYPRILHHSNDSGHGGVCVHARRRSAGWRRLPERARDITCRHQYRPWLPVWKLLRRHPPRGIKLLSLPGFRRRQLPGDLRHQFVSRACKPSCSNNSPMG